MLALICYALVTMAAGCRGQSVISRGQAMDAVRAFEGNSTLQLTCHPIEEDLEGVEWEHERTYRIYDSQNEDHRWTVDAVTGEVTRASYYEARSEVRTEEPTGPLTQEQCRQIAENFARAKYAEFDTMGFQLKEPKWKGDGWWFSWRRKNTYGAWIPNSISVRVSPADGRIQYYGCSRLAVPMPPPQAPQITAEQAIEIVKTAKGLVTGGANYDPELSQDPDNTMWAFDVLGDNAQGEHLTYAAGVDAITGEILYADEPMGGSQVPSPTKPSVVAGKPISTRDLAAKIPGAKVEWLGKEAKLFVGKNRYTLVPGKDTIEWTGGTIKLAQKMKVVNGRLMVPSGLLDVLKSAPAPKKAPPPPAKSK